MIAKRFSFNFSDAKLVEKVVEDDHAAINHVVLAKGDALPEHATNSFIVKAPSPRAMNID